MNTLAKDESAVVIIGAGQAGGECAAALRMAGHAGPVTLVGAEEHLPYSRPPLSKAYLLGESDVKDLYLRPHAFYDQQKIRTVLGRRVTAIDRAGREILLDDGERIAYAKLILATGGAARHLSDPVAEAAPNVHYLRGIADVEALRPGFVPGARLVVVGGGYVGLEIASVGRKLGMQVTVLEAADRLLARVAGPEVSGFFKRIHVDEGVQVRVDAFIDGFEADESGRVTSVRLATGEKIAADVVLVGIGLVPNDGLAAAAGLEVGNGVVVDEYCRTSDPSIYAIGDIALHPCSEHGGRRRLESVPNANEQARVAAAAITGAPKAYSSVPWFWSDQYDFKLQSVGLSTGSDIVVFRGDIAHSRYFAAFYLKNGLVRAAEVVGSTRDFAAAKKLVTARARVEPEQLADVSIPLKEILAVHSSVAALATVAPTSR